MPGETLSYSDVRDRTVALCAPLAVEDFVVQSMADASPVKWHLAHTTWFFETFLAKVFSPGYRTRHPAYAYLFNSYYNAVGTQFRRDLRGTLSRPTVDEVMSWRRQVDETVVSLLARGEPEIDRLVTIGLHHEQQHQELLITDVKNALVRNPVFERYADPGPASAAMPLAYVDVAGATFPAGYAGDGFCFDNEQPQHAALVHDFRLANRPATNREYVEFMGDGYSRHDLWLSDAWTWLHTTGTRSPLYWVEQQGQWFEQTLGGVRRLDLDAPVTHVSWFEADAFARWSNARLPTEFEWELAATTLDCGTGSFIDSELFHPIIKQRGHALEQMLGEVWEWTASPYRPYPGYRAPAGALGEYNGKFMNGQYVLKGGSCATPPGHIRTTYRNFFPPEKQWQFSGIRLAKDAS